MKLLTSTLSLAALIGLTACGDPECLDNERRVGDQCIRIRTTTPDGSAATAEDDDAGAVTGSKLDASSGFDSASATSEAGASPSTDASTQSADTDAAPGTQVPAEPCPGSSPNECGGCTPLEHKVNETCSNGGTGPCAMAGSYQCLGDKLICNAPPPTPGVEMCDGMDNDCDGMVDEGVLNACKTCGAVPAEVCDGVDNDCDGVVDEGFTKNACGGCGATPVEVCDGKDNDCDGTVDEADSADAQTWYPDCDGDGYAVFEGGVKSCSMPASTVGCKGFKSMQAVNGTMFDCRDDSALYFPGNAQGWWQAVAAPTGSAATVKPHDFNCDGKVEVVRYAAISLAGSSFFFPECSAAMSQTSCPSCFYWSQLPTVEQACGWANMAPIQRMSGTTCLNTTDTVRFYCR